MSITQTGRFLKCTTKLGADTLIVTNFSGKDKISKPFHYHFDFISSEENIAAKDILHTPITLEIQNGGKEPRYFNALIDNFSSGSLENGMRRYHATAIPRIAFLKHTKNYRIFQDKNSLTIFKEICEEYDIHEGKDYEIKVPKNKPPVRTQCTQFDESALAFLLRILAEDGIFFFFKHTKDKHMMVLANEASIHAPCPEPKIIFNPDNARGDRHQITSWHRDYQFYSGKYTHGDYNLEKPTECLHTTHETPSTLPKAKLFEKFHYAGGHNEYARGETLATQRFEAEQVKHDMVQGAGNHTCFSPGSTFELAQHPNKKEIGTYILLEVNHTASDESYLSGTPAAGKTAQEYKNVFSCIPKKIPYRPEYLPKPRVTSPQTAFVVGSGKEKEGIFTDSLGRVLVQFHWQWRGNEKLKGEPDTAWVRVAQSWAGNGYGTFFLPRIGQEVVVQFINGDPDLPLVTGCVYNTHFMPPFKLPANKTQSGIRTRTLNGGVTNENVLRFEDKKGSEEIYIHAEKDFNQQIKNNLSITVDNDYTHETKHDEIHTIGNNLSHKTTNNAHISVGKNTTQTTGKDLKINIGETGIIQAGKSLKLIVGGNTIVINDGGIFLNGTKVKLNLS